MVRSDGTPLESYTNFPEISTQGPTFSQEDYRWYENFDDETPTTSLAAENTPISAIAQSVTYRIRMNLELSNQNLPVSGQSFKLQFSTSTGGSWTDVGALASGEIWRGFDNPSGQATDGATITTLLSTSNVGESYEEENPSVVNPNAISTGQRAEWDWVVQDNVATADTTFYFRMVTADDTPLDSYTRFPQITTAPPLVLTQQDYRWYQNLNNKTPTTSLAAENTALTGVTPLTIVRLRMNVGASGSNLNTGSQAFTLQYATSTGGAWTDIGAIDSATTWRGFDNSGGTTDGTAIPSLLLTSSEGRPTRSPIRRH